MYNLEQIQILFETPINRIRTILSQSNINFEDHETFFVIKTSDTNIFLIPYNIFINIIKKYHNPKHTLIKQIRIEELSSFLYYLIS